MRIFKDETAKNEYVAKCIQSALLEENFDFKGVNVPGWLSEIIQFVFDSKIPSHTKRSWYLGLITTLPLSSNFNAIKRPILTALLRNACLPILDSLAADKTSTNKEISRLRASAFSIAADLENGLKPSIKVQPVLQTLELTQSFDSHIGIKETAVEDISWAIIAARDQNLANTVHSISLANMLVQEYFSQRGLMNSSEWQQYLDKQAQFSDEVLKLIKGLS